MVELPLQQNGHPHYSTGLPCEFCQELDSPSSSRFAQMYGKHTASRIVARQDEVVAMPTLGQLFKGSMLILPRAHFETMAQLHDSILEQVLSLLKQVEIVLKPHGHPVIFEHGARCFTGSSCGIYHAHLHMTPVPGEILIKDVLPHVSWHVSCLREAYAKLKNSNHYLIFCDTTGQIAALDLHDTSPNEFPSQYFRRTLTKHFSLEQPWDWRVYNYREPWILETLEWFGAHYVSI